METGARNLRFARGSSNQQNLIALIFLSSILLERFLSSKHLCFQTRFNIDKEKKLIQLLSVYACSDLSTKLLIITENFLRNDMI